MGDTYGVQVSATIFQNSYDKDLNSGETWDGGWITRSSVGDNLVGYKDTQKDVGSWSSTCYYKIPYEIAN